MKPVSGYVSCDGKFFLSAEACRAHEEEHERRTAISKRSKTVIECFASGTYLSKEAWADSPLPESLFSFITDIPEGDIEELWNNHLLHLLVDDSGPIHEKRFPSALYEIPAAGGSREANAWDFFMLKAETAYRLLAFVLGKPL